jgi:hypothetical protein
MNVVDTHTQLFLRIFCNISLPSTLRSPKLSVPFYQQTTQLRADTCAASLGPLCHSCARNACLGYSTKTGNALTLTDTPKKKHFTRSNFFVTKVTYFQMYVKLQHLLTFLKHSHKWNIRCLKVLTRWRLKIIYIMYVCMYVYIYSVIQKDGLKFVRLYFLNYTWYVNDLHNIWKRWS